MTEFGIWYEVETVYRIVKKIKVGDRIDNYPIAGTYRNFVDASKRCQRMNAELADSL